MEDNLDSPKDMYNVESEGDGEKFLSEKSNLSKNTNKSILDKPLPKIVYGEFFNINGDKIWVTEESVKGVFSVTINKLCHLFKCDPDLLFLILVQIATTSGTSAELRNNNYVAYECSILPHRLIKPKIVVECFNMISSDTNAFRKFMRVNSKKAFEALKGGLICPNYLKAAACGLEKDRSYLFSDFLNYNCLGLTPVEISVLPKVINRYIPRKISHIKQT